MIEDKQKTYHDNRIRKNQLIYLIRPIIYAILLAVPEGLTTKDITYIINNTRGTRQYKLSFDKIEGIIKSYKGSKLSIFIKHGDKWKLREYSKICLKERE